MTSSVVALAVEGPAAPPRSNGELVFSEPWESRIFGVAVSMHQAGCFEWPAFQSELIAAIARWEATHQVHDASDSPGGGEPFSYYTCWLQALESLLDRMGVVAADQLRDRVADQRSRPAGHDHDHDHDHDQNHGHEHGPSAG